MKRRHSANESRNEPAKRPNHGQHLDAVYDAIDSLIQCSSTATFDDDAINQLTTALDCLDNARMSLLRARANILVKISKSADAVADALKIIESDPTSVIGYLTAGQIYADQGKQQQAVDIYERGICALVPSEWPSLSVGREAARQRLDQGVDFVAKLPAEILESIFAQAVCGCDDTLAYCLQVSKRWRDCLLYRCSTLWKTAYIIKAHTPCTNAAAREIRNISNQVRSLTIKCATNSNLKYLLDLAENGKLSLVSKLKIESHEETPQDLMQYISLINLLRDNLTKLSILWRNETKETLGTILSLCPKLEYLRLSETDNVLFNPPQPPPRDGYQLRRLCLQSDNEHQPLEYLLPHCPRLEALAAIDIEPYILDLVDRYCPLLRHINANCYEDPPDWRSGDAYEDQNPPGLYTLNYNTYSDTPMRDCLSIMRKNKDTLRMLGLKLYDTIDDQILPFALSQLTKLQLRIDDGRFATAESIIQQSPMLEDVSLNFRGSRAPDHFFMCLETCTRLRVLKLSEFDANPSDLWQFFDNQAARHQSCALREIWLLECAEDVVTDVVLNTLANISTLRRIDLNDVLESTTYEGIVLFVRQLHRLPQLETIRLEELEEVTDDIIVEIAKIDGLRALYLLNMDEITSSGVRALVDNASYTLQNVCVVQCSGVDEETRRYLYRKLPYTPNK